MQRIFTGIGRFSVRYRWMVLVGWVVAAVAVVALLPSLSSVTQNDTTSFLPANAPSGRASRLAEPLEAAGTTTVPVVVARDGAPLDAADAAGVEHLREALAAVPAVRAVKDAGRSADGQAERLTVVSTLPSRGRQQDAQTTLVHDLRAAVAGAALPAGLQAHLAGAVAVNVDNNKQSARTGARLQLLSILFIVALLVLVFRALLAPLVTLLPAALVVAMAGPLVAEATRAGLHASSVAEQMLIILVLGAGTDYGLFLVFRVREELRAGRGPREAVVEAVARVGESITFSAATVIAALLSLLAASFGVYSDLGLPLAIGIGLMLLAGLTLLPALLAVLGRAVFWPGGIRSGTGGTWARLSGRVVRHPVVTLAVGVLLFGGLAIATTGFRSAGFGGTTTAPAGSDSAAGTALLATHFPRTAANPTQLVFRLARPAWDDPAPLAEAQRRLQAAPEFRAVTGPLSPNGVPLAPDQLTKLHALLGPPADVPADGPAAYRVYRATAGYLSADGRTVQFSVVLAAGDPASTAAMRAVPAVRARTAAVARAIGATDSGVAGQAAGLYDVSDISAGDMTTVIPIAIAVIGLLLALVMRSLVAPLYLIVSVALSYFAALGLSVLLFIDVAGSAGLIFVLPFLMFIFLLALGEDYNILVMSRIREEAHRYPLREAVRRALTTTGTTVTSAGLVLAGTFGVLAFVGATTAGNTQLRDMGTGLALGILMDTFLVRTLLVPSTVILLGRWNWWPSRIGRQ
jgi:RND superfamily putative drug exporter